jgi:Holliday junction resolvase RusA-like endonuclease
VVKVTEDQLAAWGRNPDGSIKKPSPRLVGEAFVEGRSEILASFLITPMGKPRMVRSDAWKKRKVVLRYWELKDEINRQANEQDFILPESFKVVFHVPMPKSWSKKKKRDMLGQKHQQRPDLDNYIKSLCDWLSPEDSYIWDIRATKLWAEEGKIEVFSI